MDKGRDRGEDGTGVGTNGARMDPMPFSSTQEATQSTKTIPGTQNLPEPEWKSFEPLQNGRSFIPYQLIVVATCFKAVTPASNKPHV